MSIQQNFPTISPSLNLNFARSKTLDPRITFTRTSSGTRTNETGLVEVVPANSPRFDHSYDPVSGTVRSLGLLVEELRVNYETNTEDPTQWTTSNMIPTGNSVILPTGQVSTTVEYRGETTDPNNKFIRPQPSGSGITAGDTWVYSGFYKKGVTNGERYIHIVLQNNTASESTGRRFDFDTGTWASSQSLNNVTVADSGYQKYPNDWYRIWMSCTFPSASGAVQTITRLFTNSTSIPYDTSFSLWGAQLEKASFMTSYIPNNTGSQITRTADNVSMVGENFSSWYNPSEGTVYADTNINGVRVPSFNRLWSFTNSNFNLDGLGFYSSNSSTSDGRYAISGAINGVSIYSPNNIITTISVFDTPRMKSCFGFVEGGNCNISFNGVLPNTNGVTATDFPNVDRFLIGQPQRFQGHSCMTISQLNYYPRRLTNSQLQALTK